MITIKVQRREGFARIELSGHAGYAPSGKDIVCASVSSVYFTLINTLEEFDKDYFLKEEDPFVVMSETESSMPYFDMAIIGLKCISQTFEDYVSVVEE